MSNSVIYTFKAIDTNVVKSLKNISGGLKRVTRESKILNRSFSGVRKNIGAFSTAINGRLGNLVAGVGIFSALSKGIAVGAQFQDSMADLEAITGATGEALKFMKDQSLDLAKATATSQSEVVTAFKLIASAKSELLDDPEGLAEITKQVLTLANTGIDVQTSAKTTTQALNQFGEASDQAARFVNVLAAGSRIGASEVSETGVAILKSGAVAKSVGVSFEELNSAIQTLAVGGVKAEIAGTGLKTALLQLEKVGAKEGINKIRPSVVGLTTALENLNEMQLNTTQLQQLFGNEAFAVGSILIENSQLVSNWTRKITGSNEAQRQADVRLKTFSSRMRVLGTVISSKVISLFERIEPVIKSNGVAFGDWIDAIDEDKIQSFSDTLLVLVDGMAMVAKGFGKIVGFLKITGRLIGEVSASIATMNFSEFTVIEDINKKLDNSFIGGANTPGGLISKFLFGDKKESSIQAPSSILKSQTDVNVNLNAPKGIVESIKSKTTGSKGTNVGVNMAGAL